MKAIIRTQYGSPDVLELVDIERPVPAKREVLVRVEAAGVDIGVWHLMTGLPTMARIALGARRPRLPGLGTELAGVVEGVGADVTRFRIGDSVFGAGRGAFAEYAIASEDKLASRPAGVTAQQAAASAVSGVTAVQALDAGRVAAGQRVLVLGASGGVGSFVVQIAKALGAHVTGVASTSKLESVRALGADEVIDYTTTDATDGSQRYDLIVDMGGNRPLAVLRRALGPRGRAVIVGGEDGGGRVLGGFQRSMFAGLASAVRRQRVVGLVSLTTTADLLRVGELLASGTMTSRVDGVYPLTQTADAIRRLEARHVRGKLVIDLGLGKLAEK
ncbi:MAG: NADPH:quinone reductase and related Zn-dependent oxidoreductase [Schumannella sp.]|nr:NADPH:quinone reductase and related Zn-dependent oxidoreductase [Schumannella sp.]